MTQVDWKPIREAPVGPTILLANENTKSITVGYGEWFDAPMPRWIAVDPAGFGRWKPTHWAALPDFEAPLKVEPLQSEIADVNRLLRHA